MHFYKNISYKFFLENSANKFLEKIKFNKLKKNYFVDNKY